MEIVPERLRSDMLDTILACRFCLSQDVRLTSIYAAQEHNKGIPLELQIMACVGLEVYKEDGMPGMICENCRVLMGYCYQFKQMCNNAAIQLKSFLSTGILPEKQSIPKELMALLPNGKQPQYASAKPKLTANIEKIKESEKSGTIVKLSPIDLKNIKQAQKRNLIINSVTSTTQASDVEQSIVSDSPLRTSTPIVKRPTPDNARTGTHSNGKQKSPGNSKDTPIILNKLVNSATGKVKEEFVATGEGTVEMLVTYDTVPTTSVAESQPDQVFPCNECTRTFPLKQLLDIHQLNHKRERNYPCNLCTKRFFSKYDLAKHFATHTGERPFVCVICRASFSRSTLLTRHQAIHKDEPKHICTFCERTFLSQEELIKHIENHEKNRPFKCASCPKQFAYKQGLERHEVVHKEVLPYQCEYCEQSFLTPVKLSRHLSSHAGDRPYPCRLCTKSFLLSHHLSRHLRSHNACGQSEYKCNDCKSLFNSMDELVRHSADHTSTNFTCPLCREQFEDQRTVAQHIKTHSGHSQYACDYCDLMYTSEAKLDEHCLHQHLNELAYVRSELQHKQLIQEDGNQFQIKINGEDLDDEAVQTNDLDATEDESTLVPDPLHEGEMYEITEIELSPVGTDEKSTKDVLSLTDAISKVQPSSVCSSPPKKIHMVALPVAQTAAASMLDAKASRLQRMEEFYKRNQQAAEKKMAQRNISDMLKKLPKGVTVKRPTPASASSSTSDLAKESEEKISVKEKEAAPPVSVAVKKGPGRPPKVPKSTEPMEAKAADVKELKKEELKNLTTMLAKQHVRTEKQITDVKELKPTTSAVVISRGQENAASTSKAIKSRESTGMIRRTYAPGAATAVAKKRPAEKDDTEVEAPSKRPALSRKTLNPSMLYGASSKQGSKEAGTASVSNSSDKINERTQKRVSKPSTTTAATPMEVNLGGNTVKLQKISKEQMMARTSKVKGKM